MTRPVGELNGIRSFGHPTLGIETVSNGFLLVVEARWRRHEPGWSKSIKPSYDLPQCYHRGLSLSVCNTVMVTPYLIIRDSFPTLSQAHMNVSGFVIGGG